MDEADLIYRSQAGDHEAFRLLVERHSKVLFGTAYLMMRDYGMAEDAVQEAFVRAWKALPSFRPYGSLKAWLVRVLVNEVRGRQRKRRIQEAPFDECMDVPPHPDGVEDEVLREEERQALRRAIGSLNDEHREVVVLRYYAELSVPEIAKALSCREGTVKSRLHRALERLGRTLADSSGHEG